MSLIDKDALMQSLGITNMKCDKCAWFDWEWGNCKRGGDFEDACCAIENAPTIEERKKGEWTVKEGELAFWDVCGVCRKKIVHRTPHYNFCPNCGARMEITHD